MNGAHHAQRAPASLFLTHVSNLPLMINRLTSMVNLPFLPPKRLSNCSGSLHVQPHHLLESASSHPGRPHVSPTCSTATCCHHPVLHTPHPERWLWSTNLMVSSMVTVIQLLSPNLKITTEFLNMACRSHRPSAMYIFLAPSALLNKVGIYLGSRHTDAQTLGPRTSAGFFPWWAFPLARPDG